MTEETVMKLMDDQGPPPTLEQTATGSAVLVAFVVAMLVWDQIVGWVLRKVLY